MEKLTLDKRSLRKFAITMGVVFFAIALVVLVRHRYNPLPISVASLVFFILAVTVPGVLKPVYITWMKFAFILGWINTRLILILIFYLIFTPIGLLIKLFGVDLLDRKTERNKDSYWKTGEKKTFNPADYQRLF